MYRVLVDGDEIQPLLQVVNWVVDNFGIILRHVSLGLSFVFWIWIGPALVHFEYHPVFPMLRPQTHSFTRSTARWFSP